MAKVTGITKARRSDKTFTICFDEDIEEGIKKALKKLVEEY